MTHHDIFDSLTRNAFDFLERGIAEFDKSPKYSVIHFCAAVEMLLKARLISVTHETGKFDSVDMVFDNGQRLAVSGCVPNGGVIGPKPRRR